jgi:polyphosphate kinase 2 (PPK2 family)
MTVLSMLDMQQTISKSNYQKELIQLQGKLNQLHREAAEKKTSILMLFEGPDAAGKGGAIRRMTAAMEARNYKVLPFAAPTDEERAQHYLWRFWRHLSRAGRVTVFDRSWYGRVLVERVEGFASEAEWQRAYAEINDFEQQLTEHGIILLKFWVHISKDEQLARFKAREETPHKRWKLTDEDWRNREKWEDYENAAHEMVQRTSTLNAPWTLIEGNDKKFARIKVLRVACEAIEKALKKQKKKG